jgi:hypothetical protein
VSVTVPKSLIYASIAVFGLTSIIWISGVANHSFLASEFWIYVAIFLVPASAVCACIWLVFRGPLWQRIIGLILLLPSLGVWIISLLLVLNGFRIH